MDNNFETEVNIPKYCPKCDNELDLDVELDGKSTLLCPNSDCDYELDITKELEAVGNELEMDEDL